jgi:hypothetical protein
VGRRVAFRWGSLVYIDLADRHWRRFDFGRSSTSESRGWVLGQDEDSEKRSRLAVVLTSINIVLIIGIKHPRNSIIF